MIPKVIMNGYVLTDKSIEMITLQMVNVYPQYLYKQKERGYE